MLGQREAPGCRPLIVRKIAAFNRMQQYHHITGSAERMRAVHAVTVLTIKGNIK